MPYLRMLACLALAIFVNTIFGQSLIAADLSKTLHVLILNGETGMDPATASDSHTISIEENIFDSLLRYDYLARPLKLQENTVVQMPTVGADGVSYTFHIKPGIYFTPDAAFNGRQRELTAQDYVYSFKRLYDPALHSPWLFLFDGKIVGDQMYRQGKQAKQPMFDYHQPLEGLQALDRYTLRIRLNQPEPNFLFALAMPATGAVAREVIEAYRTESGSHPVGTGPFMIEQWQRSNKIVLQANPRFRKTIFQSRQTDSPEDKAIAQALNGKQLPLIGRIEIKIMEEPQSRILGFLKGEFDYIEQVPPSLADMILQGGQLKRELKARGIGLSLFPLLQTNYMWMNMQDSIIGGYALERIALRRAIAYGYNQAEDIRLLDHGLALPAQSPLPPNVLGHEPGLRNSIAYDPVMARALLDHFGYRDRNGDGYREMPDGKPLVLLMHSVATGAGRLRDELWRRSLDAIGIRVQFKSDKFSEIIKASRLGKVQMFDANWVADYPDGENFFQLLYGSNIGRANYARFDLPQYNRHYEQARSLPDATARVQHYRAMAQLVQAYAPWVVRTHPLSIDVRHSRVKNYKRHPVENTAWRYLDIDMLKK